MIIVMGMVSSGRSGAAARTGASAGGQTAATPSQTVVMP